ncbi:thioesterase II family protein [Streptomyces sp. CA-132043]|uniref:thioesterase II family protein n=1 Tax=Streptomyces sp. CA-132043 TaxID=3240048 RepID=UPI003D949019
MTTAVMCLPFAGAGAGIYRRWRGAESAALRAVPIQVPGREEEFGEPFYTTIAEAASGTARRIQDAAVDGQPFLVFGHSFGAILAYEATRHLAETGGPLPRRLVVSGSTSPSYRQAERLDGDDEEVIERAKAIAGRDIPEYTEPQLRDLLLPVMRADVNLMADYVPLGRDPLPLPITAIRGDQDPLAPEKEWLDWAAFTSEDFDTAEFTGGHMYLTECWPQLWKTLEQLV